MFQASVAQWRSLSPDVRPGDHPVVLHARGDIDLATVPQWERALTETTDRASRPQAVIADLTEVQFLACCALPALAAAHHRCVEQGTPMLVVGNPLVTRILTLSRLHEQLTIYQTLAMALTPS